MTNGSLMKVKSTDLRARRHDVVILVFEELPLHAGCFRATD